MKKEEKNVAREPFVAETEQSESNIFLRRIVGESLSVYVHERASIKIHTCMHV